MHIKTIHWRFQLLQWNCTLLPSYLTSDTNFYCIKNFTGKRTIILDIPKIHKDLEEFCNLTKLKGLYWKSKGRFLIKKI